MPPFFLATDLDNTLVSYGSLFRDLAVGEGLLPPETAPDKTEVRDALRVLPGGEKHWQRLQALAYGERIGGATVEPLARSCLEGLHALGIRLAVVSHKTRFANPPYAHVDLHRAAMDYLGDAGLLAPLGPLDPALVFFEETRALKVARIASLMPSHFLDDLPEVLSHEAFPKGVARLLYDPSLAAPIPPGAGRAISWSDVWRVVTGLDPAF